MRFYREEDGGVLVVFGTSYAGKGGFEQYDCYSTHEGHVTAQSDYLMFNCSEILDTYQVEQIKEGLDL